MLADRKVISDILTTWIQVAALLVAGIFASIQYVQKVQDDKVKASLDFFNRYNQAPLFDTRRDVEKAWQRVAEEREAGEKRLDPGAYASYSMGVVDKAGIVDEIMITVSFFGAVEVCIENDICDSKTLISRSRREALLCTQRQRDPSRAIPSRRPRTR